MSDSPVSSYPSIFAVGHRVAKEIFVGPVVVEEKIDGSQFSFSVDEDGTIHCRSKGKEININDPDKMFAAAVETVKKLASHARKLWIYRGEYLSKPKHNTISYERVPKDHIIIFDIETSRDSFLTPSKKRWECDRLGLECVPCLYEGEVGPGNDYESTEDLKSLLDVSCLGNVKPEGFVIKNYEKLNPEKRILICKHVTPEFKEIHSSSWKASNPGTLEIVQNITTIYKTVARWKKAVQHLREQGLLVDEPKDIALLVPEIARDVLGDSEADIKEMLWAYAWPKIKRGLVNGFPEWYKEQLEQNFNEEFKNHEKAGPVVITADGVQPNVGVPVTLAFVEQGGIV